MKEFKFPNKETAKIFAETLGVEGETTEKDGEVIFAYSDEKASVSLSQEDLYRSIDSVYRYTDSRCEELYRRMDRLVRAFAMHQRNHLPSPKSASQMEKAVKALGMGDDYEVRKNVIYVESGDNSLEASYY